jgi:hypothetical protein
MMLLTEHGMSDGFSLLTKLVGKHESHIYCSNIAKVRVLYPLYDDGKRVDVTPAALYAEEFSIPISHLGPSPAWSRMGIKKPSDNVCSHDIYLPTSPE